MTDDLEAILFDMGGTLRASVPAGEAAKRAQVQQMMELIGASGSVQEFGDLLSARAKAYMKWARETLVELDEERLWTGWMLPDWPAHRIQGLAVQLNQIWRAATGVREVYPESRAVALELFRRGYRLGIASNTVSSVEVPRLLRELELSGCFETVILSCNFGQRKPGPEILLEAARRIGVLPERCVYIGDRLDRDVISARRAGFAQVIIRRNPETFAAQQHQFPALTADGYVDDLNELLDLFPPRHHRVVSRQVYAASLSTMWARRNLPALSDFFEAAGRLGFAGIELNHQIDTAMLSPVRLERYRISSIHEPCPADISTELLKARDWLISSPDAITRAKGVEAIKRSIDLADRLDVPLIVVHCGMVSADLTLEKRLRQLFDAGSTETAEYSRIKQELIDSRARLIAPRFAAVKESLRELLEYAGRLAIRLGLENRYHYFDIPSPDELGELLALAGPDRLGFVYDVGHAQALDRLGFYPHEGWLQRYSARMLEVHLHDVRGVNDHFAPGRGEVDFQMIGSYLPEAAVRTLEIQPENTPEQVRASLQFLARHRCINLL